MGDYSMMSISPRHLATAVVFAVGTIVFPFIMGKLANVTDRFRWIWSGS